MGAGDGGVPSYIDEHHQRIAEFADDFLDEDEREEFVDSLLERHGYQRQTHWAPPDAGGGQGGGRGGRRQPLVKPKRPPAGGQGGQRGGGRGGYFRG